jgi:hypothetical protein
MKQVGRALHHSNKRQVTDLGKNNPINKETAPKEGKNGEAPYNTL